MKTNNNIKTDIKENMLYKKTHEMLKNYREMTWSIELAVQQIQENLPFEYGSIIDDFLESIYITDADLSGNDIEKQAGRIEWSNEILKLMLSAVEFIKNKHMNGETYYWILYYTFFSSQELKNSEEIVEKLCFHLKDISLRTYFRKKQAAIALYASVFWSLNSKNFIKL